MTMMMMMINEQMIITSWALRALLASSSSYLLQLYLQVKWHFHTIINKETSLNKSSFRYPTTTISETWYSSFLMAQYCTETYLVSLQAVHSMQTLTVNFDNNNWQLD